MCAFVALHKALDHLDLKYAVSTAWATSARMAFGPHPIAWVTEATANASAASRTARPRPRPRDSESFRLATNWLQIKVVSIHIEIKKGRKQLRPLVVC